MSRELIETAIGLAGSQAKLADLCGVKQQSIWQAKDTGRCSAELAMAIEVATAGHVAARALRPDLPWPEYQQQGRNNQHQPHSDDCPSSDLVETHGAS